MIADGRLSPSVLGRSAFCERKLEMEISRGCGQYVVFAAGYDTAGIRMRNGKCSVYELDLPDVISDKKDRIEKAGLSSSSVYVPCDLSDDSWTDNLVAAGFDDSIKSFGSLLGICYYLNRNEFKNLMASVSVVMTEGSCICFDYPVPDEGGDVCIASKLASAAGEEMTERYFAAYNEMSDFDDNIAPRGTGYILAVRR